MVLDRGNEPISWFPSPETDPHFLPLIGYVALYRITNAGVISRADFGLSGRVSRLRFDTAAELSRFQLRSAQVLGQSDQLNVVNRPIAYPVYGSSVVLGSVQPNLAPGQLLAIAGKRQRIIIGPDIADISCTSDSARAPVAGDSFILLAPPEIQSGSSFAALSPEQLDPANLPSGMLRWTLLDRNKTTVTILAPAITAQLQPVMQLQPALSSDPVVSEICQIGTGADRIQIGLDTTTVSLTAPLANCYDRTTATVNANVAPATAGLTVGEIGGSGSASHANQTFTLKQSPMTYVLDSTSPTGCSSTLTAQVNGITWNEVPTLHNSGPLDRVYALSQNNDGSATVQFGDGTNGARLPTGQNNIRFSYRLGLGTAGNLRAGQLSMLLTRPAGVSAVTNPAPSTGGQDPETIANARNNAPLHVLTLDRAVSTDDYANFAASFAGIAKAYSIWIGGGASRGMYITIAGPNGETFGPMDATVVALAKSLRQFGDRLLSITVQSFLNPTFTLSATIKVADDADPSLVLPAVETALRNTYSFSNTDFGTAVTIDGVYAAIQSVSGVMAANVGQLYRIDTGPQSSEPENRLIARLPSIQSDGTVSPAELLTLDARPLQLGIMS